MEEKIREAEEFIHSKEGKKWMKENKKRLKEKYKKRDGIFSKEEDDLWEPYLQEIKMKSVRIKINEKSDSKGHYILLLNGEGRCYPNNEYEVPIFILNKLMKNKVEFEIIEE